MQTSGFEEAVEKVVERDPRYHPDAYLLLRDALDYTLNKVKKREKQTRHVTGKELCLGFRDYLLGQFGPMSMTLCREWGIGTCQDIGEMVFNLIEAQMFGRTDNDSKADFVGHYTFEEAFIGPYLPRTGEAAS